MPWGPQSDINYLRGSLWPDRLELFRLGLEYSGRKLAAQHPHRGNGGPWSDVSTSPEVTRNGPRSVGKLLLEAATGGKRTVLASGEFNTPAQR